MKNWMGNKAITMTTITCRCGSKYNFHTSESDIKEKLEALPVYCSICGQRLMVKP